MSLYTEHVEDKRIPDRMKEKVAAALLDLKLDPPAKNPFGEFMGWIDEIQDVRGWYAKLRQKR
jgi:hypothetical protein